ncbi:MAG: hypothetical protein GEV06_02990 [Luteitalea sp.]|nr:hypothetical protein [Luteitalea sp.]
MLRHEASLLATGVSSGLLVGLLQALPLASPQEGQGAAATEMNVEKVSCLRGLPNCLRLTNGDVEVVVTTDIGPRVIQYALVGGENILGEMPVDLDEKTRSEWQAWGGHRLWLAPEAMPWSYAPDNEPIEHELVPAVEGRSGEEGAPAIRLMRGVEEETGMEKEIVVALDESGSGVTLTHRLTNRGQKAVDVAAWALTIMNGGGRAILPQEPFKSHDEELLPARPVALWGYTNLADPRWSIGPKFVQLSTDSTIETPQKIGIGNKQGWAAYLREGALFVKRFSYQEDATYPDFGSNTEVFTEANFIEVETLGPLGRLEPGQSLEHVERWYLFKDVSFGQDEDAVERALTPLLEQASAQ